MIATIIQTVGDSELQEILELTVSCSPVPMVNDSRLAEELLIFIRADDNLYITLRSDSGELIGFCGLAPQDSVVPELKAFDEKMHYDIGRYYYDMIGIKETHRKTTAFLHLMLKSAESASIRGINKFSTHSITTNGINRTVQKLFPDNTVLRRIYNWMGTCHSCDYIEFTIHEKDLARMGRLLKK